ncbi:MAG: aminotransferase class I/II-fold pyridoxal phosphate-dependent enzyme [Bdellovibrionales bacterium]|nr:aminotransferase class I/II-fold pyridoxal phosphate-dependent enzyme [Bdellovibrionales bacterium]
MRSLPASGINLFQLIYILIREYEQKSGQKALNLSLGNPDTIPPKELRDLKSRFQLSTEFDLHTYAEDKNLNRFSEGLVSAFADFDLDAHPELKAVPIAGIKTAGALMPLACGLHLKDRSQFKVVSNLPAYDVIGTWSQAYFAAKRLVWPLSSEDGMVLNTGALEAALSGSRADLIFVIRPGNPAARGASRDEWVKLIQHCIQNKTRLVNDGAYTTLGGKNHIPLCQVAKDFPELEWIELFSVSKAFSDPGARLGVALGSKDFIEDFILVKGNTDSGPVPSLMAAYGELFKDRAGTKKLLNDLYEMYQGRLNWLVPTLKEAGLEPACETNAGFFTLWKVPNRAFGVDLIEEAKMKGISQAEAFNRRVIDQTGIVGVHFTGPSGEPLIRYAVCSDVLDSKFQARMQEGLKMWKVGQT